MEIVSRSGPLQDRIKFTDEEVGVVRKALKTKLFRREEDDEIRTAKYQAMLEELADKFGLPAPKLERHQGDEPGYSFDPDTNTIHVQRYSLVSILDGFAHALQHQTENGEVNMEFVMAFGLSAFKQSAPAMFELARQSGRLMGVDVPYSDGGRSPARALPPGLASQIVAQLLGGIQPGLAADDEQEDREQR
ncbi:MAG: hypothetical protein SF051_05365 [Elusimicrobiota bacterium]|nr:hypothetical protein [Elusimicrobiota bacterium]